MTVVLDAGAEDINSEDSEVFEVTAPPADFEKVKKALEAASIPVVSAEVTLLAKTHVKLAGDDAHQVISLMNELEEHDDVKNVYANFDIPKEIIEAASK